MTLPVTLSRFQTQQFHKNRPAVGDVVEISADLGLTKRSVMVVENGLQFNPADLLTWDAIHTISKSENNCFVLQGDGLRKITAFSEETNRALSLMPTSKAPTMLVAGFPMHRIKNTDPWQDTKEKIKAARPTGAVLDTATGLGYTAIRAANSAEKVVTIELDPAAQEIAGQNPWSQPLFASPSIEQVMGDSYDVIEAMENGLFSRIIHDPPTFSLGGHLYSSEYYANCHRILRGGGRMFHYIGDPESRSGRNITRGVIRRLSQVGFKRVVKAPRAFGVVAIK